MKYVKKIIILLAVCLFQIILLKYIFPYGRDYYNTHYDWQVSSIGTEEIIVASKFSRNNKGKMVSFTDGNDSYRLSEVSHEASKKERDFEFNKPYCMTFIFKKI